MKKKLSIFMIIFVLLNAFSALIVGAEKNRNYNYKEHSFYESAKENTKYEISFIYYDNNNDRNNAEVGFFYDVPTLYYDSNLDVFYLSAENIRYAWLGEYGAHGNSGFSYLYIDDINNIKKSNFSETLLTGNVFTGGYAFVESENLEIIRGLKADFTPIFDESVPYWAKQEWASILSDDAFNGYQDNIVINVAPEITSSPTKSWSIPKEFLKPDVSKLVNYDVSDYFFTVTVINKGSEPFEFILTCNSEKYNERNAYYQHMKESADDLLNTFHVDGNPLIRVEGNSTFTYNFNFSEIDHDSSIPTAFGGLTPLPFHQIYLNFWTQETYRVAYDGLPVWKMPEIDPETGLPIIDEDEIDEDGVRIFERSQAYRCCYSHDFSFYGTWRTKPEKPENYRDIVNQLPISDLIVDNQFSSVDFNLNPDIDDFKNMIENSKNFLELVRVVMSNFVPQFMWVIIAMGLTAIVVLRILGR